MIFNYQTDRVPPVPAAIKINGDASDQKQTQLPAQ
jgi:hypothetical protein